MVSRREIGTPEQRSEGTGGCGGGSGGHEAWEQSDDISLNPRDSSQTTDTTHPTAMNTPAEHPASHAQHVQLLSQFVNKIS